MSLNFVRGRGAINRQVFDENPFILESPVGTYEMWTIVNWEGCLAVPPPFFKAPLLC